MKKSRQPTLIVLLLLPSLSLLFLAVTAVIASSAQQYVVPCHFNPMCSCKMSRTPMVDEANGGGGGGGGGGYANEPETDERNRTLTELEALLAEEIDRGRLMEQDTVSISSSDGGQQENVFDVSCVGVPFAFLPALPPGKISHVDIVNSGLEVADRIPPWKNSPSTSASQSRIRIESLRLMSNKIRHIGEHIFSGMEEDLKSLDLSYNELNEIPVAPLKTLQSLVWANFHNNQISSLEGLGQLWTHLSPNLDALFLGNNDITSLQRSKTNDGRWDGAGHSLALLRNLNWLNVDGNQLVDLPSDTLPRQLHTISAANNRIVSFPSKLVEQLRELRWLDLRGNFIHQLPVNTIRTEPGTKLRLEKLDLGENLISTLPAAAMFNRSLHIRALYLDFNRITRLPDSAFRGTNVHRLYLAANGLADIDERAFHSLSSTLTLLDMDRNSLNSYPTALDYLKRLRFLYLANNRISRFSHGNFASFGLHLEELSLAGNKLGQFPASVLRNCPKLVHLNLAYNTIESVTSEMFYDWGGNLEVLILKGNQIKQLPSHLFRHTHKLRELSFSFNRLTSIDDDAFVDVAETLETLELNMILDGSPFPTGLLKHLHQLQWLSLEYNRIVSLSELPLDHLHKLHYLSLEGNRIAAVNRNSFGGKLRSLRDVRLSHNLIESLPQHTFHNLDEVTTIVLANNRLQVIKSSAFEHLPKLVTLNLAYNHIGQLEGGAFKRLPNLLKIDLQSNRLHEFSWDALTNCTNVFMSASVNLSDNAIAKLRSGGGGGKRDDDRLYIKAIDLSRNILAAFPDAEFLSVLAPSSLKKLLLGDNKIAVLPDKMLSKSCQDLQVLELQRNSIQDVERHALTDAVSLQIIDLSENHLETIPVGFFAHLKRLRIVNLSRNRIRLITKDIFEGTVLETLNVAHNHLKHFPNCLLPISSTLINLDVSHNHIDHLDAVMLSNTPNLISLNLAHNKLTLLPDNVFSHLNHLISLDLSYNTIRANFKELFHEIQHVKELGLANIGLAQWPHLPLPSLITLNLSSNALDCRTTDHIPSNLVIRLGHLRNLDLSRNRFTLVPAFLWPSMPLLKHLDLSSNPIRLINRDSFAALVRLQTLSLQSIGVPVLENIDGDSLHSLFSLTHIRIQTWPGPHLSQLLGGLRGLRKLSVEVKSPVLSSQFNYIATIDTAPKLREIEISGAHLKTISPDVFANTGIHTLPECGISLKKTSVRYLPERFINGLEGCASLTLDLRDNTLQSIGLPSIQNNNSLSATSTRHLAGGLRLENNHLVCSCTNSWLGKWLKRWYLETTSIRHPITSFHSEISCQDPASHKMVNLNDVPVSEKACSNAAFTAVSVSNHNHFAVAPFALAVSILHLMSANYY